MDDHDVARLTSVQCVYGSSQSLEESNAYYLESYAITLFAHMPCVEQGFKPDDKTYTSILAGCSHAGLMEQGHQYFKSVEKDLGNLPGVEVYSCMADLLGRSGCLSEAIDLLHAAPSLPEIVTWKSLLTSCRTHKSAELGRWAFDQMLHLDSHDAFGYVVMSNMYADANMWEKVEYIRSLRNMAGAVLQLSQMRCNNADYVNRQGLGYSYKVFWNRVKCKLFEK
ncbi:hypothetical protein GOP47_0011686 [Adiantum capillus-veneris]|uniref:Pentatricopeptide repeat-containing protein n=1 Tax=Adiantum capillus-veneris TaxID=13818 RepID=A0A9D4ZFM4_ADICA|nr:hypothetical protein GOP47_0011686 [Adiantum capillus-veneris]